MGTGRLAKSVGSRSFQGVLLGLSLLALSHAASVAAAAEVVYLARGATWKFFPGTQEASSPDVTAWRSIEFDDTSWADAPAPIGFGDESRVTYGTNLSTFDPPMRNNYSSFYVRRVFEIPDASKVVALVARLNFDDGAVVWVNGREVVRANMEGITGDPTPHYGEADGGHEQGDYEEYDLGDPAGFLLEGENIVTAQVFNSNIASSDSMFDLELVDPFGPDLLPPRTSFVIPTPDTPVRSLTQIEITFDEAVTGVDASDLLINGQPAEAVSGDSAGPYTFRFEQPPLGAVDISWASDADIFDFAAEPNAFGGEGWSYTLDPEAPLAELEITEIVAVNATGHTDEDRETSDWFEIHNAGPSVVNLAGFSVSDDPADPSQYVFPNQLMQPGERLVVFASGKDRAVEGSPLHTGFKLAAGGEYLAIYTPEVPRRALFEYSPRYPEQRADVSYGLDSEGRRSYFDTPTPGAPNGAGARFEGFVGDPKFSVERGFFTGAFDLELFSTTSAATVYFTTDGSEPTPVNGQVYESPLRVEGTAERAVVTVRASAYRDGFLPSRTVTQTYVFPEHVLTQPRLPEGFPGVWRNGGNTTTGDYEMDPQVLNVPANRARAEVALTELPTLSLVTDMDNIFGDQRGIYVHGNLSGRAWERPASAELILADGSEGFQVDCGLRIQGGSSTNPWKSLKLSMQLEFRDDYGPTKLRHRLFPDSRVNEFDTLVLDAGLNLTWNHPDHGQRVRSQYVRDQFVSDLQKAAGWASPHGRFMNVYLNGVFWGVYDVHEKPEDDFCADYFGGETEEWDVLKHSGSSVIDGNTQAWLEMRRIAVSGSIATFEGYTAIQDFLNVDNLIDYMIVNFYVGNDDWPRHNWYAVRRRVPGAGFMMVSWDAEHVLKDVFLNQTGVSNSNSPAELFQRLRTNPEFRLRFADRARRLFGPGGPLHVDSENSEWDPQNPESNRPAELYMRRIREIDNAIVLESARWGDVRRPSNPYTRDVEWQRERDWLLTRYFPERSRIVFGQFQRLGLTSPVEAPELTQPGGVVAAGTWIGLELPEGTDGEILYTLDGSDPRVAGSGERAATARTYSEPIVVDGFTHIRARTRNEDSWSALVEGVYRLDGDFSKLRISEILYNPGSTELEFIEIWNSGGEDLDLAGFRFDEGITFEFFGASPIPANGRIVLASDAAGFASIHGDAPIAGVYVGQLDNAGERVTLRDPEGEIVVSVRYDDEDFWPIAPDGLHGSLVLVRPDADPDRAESWAASAEAFGSPGAAGATAAGTGVVVNEVLSFAETGAESWIELRNLGGRAIVVGGWYLSDSRQDDVSLRKYRIPDGLVLPAGGYALFSEADFNGAPGEAGSFSLGVDFGAVYLTAVDGMDNLSGHVAALEYRSGGPGRSTGRVHSSAGVVSSVLQTPTPGIANAPPAMGEVVINEVHYHPVDGDLEFIELANTSDIPVRLYNEELAASWRVGGVNGDDGITDFEIPDILLPAGGLVVISGTQPEFFRAFFDVPQQVPVVGPFRGAVDNGGERLRLLRPAASPFGGVAYFTEDQLRYDDRAPWPLEPDGTGPSLERLDPFAPTQEPANWQASAAADGTPGRENSAGLPPDNRAPIAVITASVVQGEAPLGVEFDARNSRDPDGSIQRYEWDYGDGARDTGDDLLTIAHTFVAPGVYDVVLSVVDDRGARGSAVLTVTVIAEGSGGLQIPGDFNQDTTYDMSDALATLGHLFLGAAAPPPPCEGSVRDAGSGNFALLNANGDDIVDLSDPVHGLVYFFLGGPPHVLGVDCVPLAGCRDNCIE